MCCFKKIRNILNVNDNKTANKRIFSTKKQLHFNDDIFNRIEFCPKENYEFLIAENKKVARNSMYNYDIFSILSFHDEIPVKIMEKEINYNALNEILLQHNMNKIEIVYENYGRLKNICQNTHAYTVSNANDAALFLSFKEGIVTHLWLYGYKSNRNTEVKNTIKNVLFDIGTKFNFILNDWESCEVIDLTNIIQIEEYLSNEKY